MDIAKKVIKEAGDYALSRFYAKKKISSKGHNDYFTEIDVECERIIIDGIKKYFPKDSFVGEESGKTDSIDGTGKYTWFIDPVDGTHNYITGIPLFGTIIGIVKDYPDNPVVEHGLIYLSSEKKLLYASLGKGAYIDGEPIKVSDKKLADSRGIVGVRNIKNNYQSVRKVIENAFDIRCIGVAAYGYYLVATGHFDFYVNDQIKDWDNAGSSIIIREAGDKLVNEKNTDWCFDKGGILATNTTNHDEIINLLKADESDGGIR